MNIYEEEKNKVSFEPHTLNQQIILPPFDGLICEYNELVIMFGYLCFFSISCPLTPLIVFALICVEKTVDTFKFFYLIRVSTIAGGKGLGIYNNIFTVFFFCGMIFSICSVVFTRRYLDNLDLYIKILLLLIFQSTLLICIYFFRWNILPRWFENRETINDKFISKYYHKSILNC